MSISELYRFVEGSEIWTYTSADQAQVHNSETYEPIAIGRNEPELRTELSRASMVVNVGLESVLGARWLSNILEVPVFLTIFKKVDATVSTFWKGRLISIKPDAAKVALTLESSFTYMRRTGVSAKFQRTCPHIHYGRGCNLDKDDFAIAATVTTVVDPVTITSAVADTYPDGTFTGGMVQTVDGYLRFVIDHTGATLKMIRSIDVAVTDAITLYPGCNRSLAVCETVFDNLDNNGSFPFIPIKNPYSGTSVV